jgi:hypothetical protein
MRRIAAIRPALFSGPRRLIIMRKESSDGPMHVHCIANYRVSAFFYRYRCTILGMDAARAQVDLDQVWQPGPVWTAFINRAHAE